MAELLRIAIGDGELKIYFSTFESNTVVTWVGMIRCDDLRW
jgi:hypothetical protein